MFAIIRSGGKQYSVSPKNIIKIEKLEIDEGKEVEFSEVLLLQKDSSVDSKESQVEIGTPLLKDVKVIGRVLRQDKKKKNS